VEVSSLELADETYIKRCSRCGKKFAKPLFYKGYVFCSDDCKSAFLAKALSKERAVSHSRFAKHRKGDHGSEELTGPTILEELELEMAQPDFKGDLSALQKFWKREIKLYEIRERQLYRSWEKAQQQSIKKSSEK
jgi:endogenous inhibitor of DNA gyrase (YacG/DUF329 family)